MAAPGASFEVPPEISDVFSKFLVTEYAYLTPRGEPLCWPVTPYWYPDRRVLGIATGLAYPNKAAYAKRDPRIAMLFSDGRSSGLDSPPEVLVQGTAHVLEDLQANADRYVVELRQKFTLARVALNPVTVKMLDFYIPRLWVEMTPQRLVVDGNVRADDIGSEPGSHSISTPAPETGLTPQQSAELKGTVERFTSAVLTTVDDHGFPAPRRVAVSWVEGDVIIRPRSETALNEPTDPVPAALTFHRHSLGGTRFDAYMARGTLTGDRFTARRLVGFFGNGLVFPFSVVPHISKLRARIRRELKERGEQMPLLRIP